MSDAYSDAPSENEQEQSSTPSSNSINLSRKFINSAIYVEKPLSATISSENASINQRVSSEDLIQIKTKRCTCSMNQKTCPCHRNLILNLDCERKKAPPAFTTPAPKSKEIKTKFSAKISNKKAADVNIVTTKPVEPKQTKKNAQNEKNLQDREKMLEEERNNFKRWLINKKKIEMDAKKKKEREIELEQLRELEKEKRQLESQLNFHLWLRKKKETDIERKIQQQLELINDLQDKEEKFKQNERAFNEWLKNAKTKQRPVSLNKGIETLCSSTSVAYINPNPWNPMP